MVPEQNIPFLGPMQQLLIGEQVIKRSLIRFDVKGARNRATRAEIVVADPDGNFQPVMTVGALANLLWLRIMREDETNG